MCKILNIDNNKIIELYNNGYGIIAISKYFGYKDLRKYIKKILIQNNIIIQNRLSRGNKIYNFNDKYFENINTVHKSYILGLIVSDGYVSKNRLIFTLKDYEILNFIKSELNSEQPIFKRKYLDKRNNKIYTSYVLTINSKKIIFDLNKLNIFNLKSYNAQMPHIEYKYYPDFFRGLFDGDGCISYNGKYYRFNQVLTKNILDIYLNILNKFNINNNKPRIISTNNNNEHIYEIKYGKKVDLINIFNYLYYDVNNIFFLKRKYNKFKNVIL